MNYKNICFFFFLLCLNFHLIPNCAFALINTICGFENVPIKELNVNIKNNEKETGYDNCVNQNDKTDLIHDGKSSLIIDLGSETTITTVDILWKNSDSIGYNYTLQIFSKDRLKVKEFNYISDFLPKNISQTSGTENTLGKSVKLIINEPLNQRIVDSIERITINTHGNESPAENNNDANLWSEITVDYPDQISLKSSDNNSTAPASLYKITDGDDFTMANPNFSIGNDSIVRLDVGHLFSIDVNYNHIEGINAELDLGTINPISLKPLNDTSVVYEGDNIKTFFFIPDVANNIDIGNRVGNITIMLATSSETSVYYKTKVNVKD